jgi:hypothetical protein
VKLKRPAHPIILFLGLGAFLAAQLAGGAVPATSCDYPNRAEGHRLTQGTKSCPCEKDCPNSFVSICCRIRVDALISPGAVREIIAFAWKSVRNSFSTPDPLTAHETLAIWKTHPQTIAGRYPSSDPPIFLIDLALII